MRPGRRYQKGFWNFIIPAVAAIGSALIGSKGQADTNQANVNLSKEQMDFNASQADLARNFSAGQAGRAQEFESNQSAISREFNASEAQKNREFQEHMASTSYQRAVGDMSAAGLNPMLGYSQGGAPMAQGSAANAGGFASGKMGQTVSASYNSLPARLSVAQAGLNAAQTAASIGNIDADSELKKAQATRELNSAENIKQQTVKLEGEIKNVGQQFHLLFAQTSSELAKKELIEGQKLLVKAQEMVENGKIGNVEADTALKKVNKQLADLDIPERKAMAEKFGGKWGQDVSPYVREAVDILRLLVYGSRGAR